MLLNRKFPFKCFFLALFCTLVVLLTITTKFSHFEIFTFFKCTSTHTFYHKPYLQYEPPTFTEISFSCSMSANTQDYFIITKCHLKHFKNTFWHGRRGLQKGISTSRANANKQHNLAHYLHYLDNILDFLLTIPLFIPEIFTYTWPNVLQNQELIELQMGKEKVTISSFVYFIH